MIGRPKRSELPRMLSASVVELRMNIRGELARSE